MEKVSLESECLPWPHFWSWPTHHVFKWILGELSIKTARNITSSSHLVDDALPAGYSENP